MASAIIPNNGLRQLQMTQHGVRYHDMGSCNKPNEGGFIKCALEPSDCEEGQDFLGHDQDSQVMKKCNANDWKIGRCIKENTCAARATDCAEDTSDANFNPDDGSCTFQRDKASEEPWDVANPAFTQFGSCHNPLSPAEDAYYFCIYDPEECDTDNGEVYQTPSETAAAGVTCDCGSTHIYGCEVVGRVMCAAKANGCRDSSSMSNTPYEAWSPHYQKELRDTKQNGIDCRLCLKRNTPEPTPNPTTKTRRPTKSPTAAPVKSVSPTTSPSDAPVVAVTTTAPTTALFAARAQGISSSSDDGSGGMDGGMLGAIVGGSVVAVAFIAVVAFVFYRTLHPKQTRLKSKGGPLPGEISLGTLDDKPK